MTVIHGMIGRLIPAWIGPKRARRRRAPSVFRVCPPEDLEARSLLSTVPGAIGTIPALTEPVGEEQDWTVMVYITATDLAEHAPDNIMEMERVAARMPDSVRIVLLYDQWTNRDANGKPDPEYKIPGPTSFPTDSGKQQAWTTAGIGMITGGTPAGTSGISTWFDISRTEVDTGDEQTLTNFIRYASMLAPAEHYALILWDHGAGVTNNNDDHYDVLDPNQLTTTKVAGALSSASGAGVDLDLLAYDECLMATTEVSYAMRDLVPVLVGSEELVNGDGYNYETALDPLTAADPGQVTPEQLAARMVTSYQGRYGGKGSLRDTLSAMDQVRTEGLVKALGNFVASTQSARVSDWEAMIQAWEYSAAYGTSPRHFYRDLGQFLSGVAASNVSSQIRSGAEAALAELESVVFAKTADTRHSMGLSIYFPLPQLGIGDPYRREVTASGFEAKTGWLGFLGRFYEAIGKLPPPEPSSWAYNNAGPASALDLGTQVGARQRVPDLMIRGGETNWFRFNTMFPGRPGNAVRAFAAFRPSRLILRLYEAGSPTTPIAQGRRAASLRFLPPGEYLLSVTSPSPNVAGRYSVKINAPRSFRVRPDLPPDNASIETAKRLGTVSGTELFSGLSRSAGTPYSWFRFATPRSEEAFAGTVTLMSDGQPLEIELLDEEGTVLARARGRNAATVAYAASGAAESYYLRVSGRPGAYSLMFAG